MPEPRFRVAYILYDSAVDQVVEAKGGTQFWLDLAEAQKKCDEENRREVMNASD